MQKFMIYTLGILIIVTLLMAGITITGYVRLYFLKTTLGVHVHITLWHAFITGLIKL